ncbi:hypothetical protein [Maridesulfovibrio sp.]|uniref:hypothetical protein n=1 Tax=Maridesulfovibrio sp. TaxID=2795000 RepID=UPI0029CA41E1|nr:hypothetical protein [Maridesulfovibrio sp.]
MYNNHLFFLAGLIIGACFSRWMYCLAFRRYKKQTETVLETVSFSRRRKKRAPFEEAISVAMSTDLKDELVRASGNQQSKYVRASLRLSLPTLKSRPILVDILDEE